MTARKPSPILEIDPQSRRVILREGFTAAFFLPSPIATVCAHIAEAFQIYLGMIPADALRWQAIGAASEAWKPVSGTTVQRCLAQVFNSEQQQ